MKHYPTTQHTAPIYQSAIINHAAHTARLEGKVALVLGATSGIGRACAIALAKNGAKVVVAARRAALLKDVVNEINAQNPNTAAYIMCDVLKLEQIERAVAFTVKTFGKIDIGVNNFGICSNQRITQLTEEQFDRDFNTNTKGTAFAMKYECLAMQSQTSCSSIINIGSTLSLVGMSGLASYSGSKHAIAGLTKSAVLDRVPNVRINCVCPGAIRTAMAGQDEYSRDPIDGIGKEYPIGRIGEVEDIANAIVFFASDESTFFNGAIVVVDGGFICD